MLPISPQITAYVKESFLHLTNFQIKTIEENEIAINERILRLGIEAQALQLQPEHFKKVAIACLARDLKSKDKSLQYANCFRQHDTIGMTEKEILQWVMVQTDYHLTRCATLTSNA